MLWGSAGTSARGNVLGQLKSGGAALVHGYGQSVDHRRRQRYNGRSRRLLGWDRKVNLKEGPGKTVEYCRSGLVPFRKQGADRQYNPRGDKRSAAERGDRAEGPDPG